tara:strand:- start:429 stop:938 length:510 start_codon:yes stop_codon:yes gene_type:complete
MAENLKLNEELIRALMSQRLTNAGNEAENPKRYTLAKSPYTLGSFDQPTVDQETAENPNVEDLSTYFARETPEVLNKLLGMVSNKATSVGESIHSGAETGVNALADFFFKPQGFRSSQDLLSTHENEQSNAHGQIDELIDSNDMKEQLSSFLDAIGKSTYPMSPNKMLR